MPEFTEFDPADYLDTPATVAAYLAECRAFGDEALLRQALANVARAKRRAARPDPSSR